MPTRESEQVDMIGTMAVKIDSYKTLVGITDDEAAQLKADAAFLSWLFKTIDVLRPALEHYTAFKNEVLNGTKGGAPGLPAPTPPVLSAPPPAVPPGAVPRVRALMLRIKNAPKYTEAIGKDLGIIPPVVVQPNATTAVTAKPKFTATVLPGYHVRLDWIKGKYSGVAIQCKRTGDANFIDIGRDNYSPFDDERPPVTAGTVEVREYRMRYLLKDALVGEWSDVVVVTAIP